MKTFPQPRRTFGSLVVALVVVLVGGWPGMLANPLHAQSTPKQGAELMKTDILGVFAHPDDETGMATALAAYALGQGRVVANVYCTRGEGGGNMVGTQWGSALGALREAELRDCLARLGVRYCYFLDQRDFFYTESLAATLHTWDHDATLERLVRYVRVLRPEVIVTMNPAPSPGQHGHHQAAGVLATEAFAAAADPTRFPDQLKREGLHPWQARKLFYSGGGGVTVVTVDVTQPLASGETPAQVAGAAMSNHRSQAFGNAANSPWMRRPQLFTLVKSAVPIEGPQTNLLQGLPVADAELQRIPSAAPPQPGVEVRFVPRPAIARYQQWVREQGIEAVAAEFPADLPVVNGEANRVPLEFHNRTASSASGEVVLEAPTGWTFRPDRLRFRLAPGETRVIEARLTPPTDAVTDVEILARSDSASVPLQAKAKAHPVPKLRVPRVSSAPALDGSDRGWEKLPTLVIGPTNRVEGKIRDEADSSALVRLGHDAKFLFVDLRVRDDVVVSNIQPDDIRGHWRSDSVEICVDPVGGSENTLGCFKLGVFPFDTTGAVRAARDADAQQGPVEETAPRTRLVSKRTADGYRIQAAIPLSELGVTPSRTRRLGFNVIIYDGDKADAAPGENINKSRLAWAFRPGVQGRPEDWGRLELE